MKAALWMVLAALCLPAVPLAAQSPSQVVECGTDSQERVLCAAGGQVASAKLVRDLSFDRCGATGSWGWTGNALWVDNSCRGEFAVSYRSATDTAATRRITCGTLSARRDQCSAGGIVDTVRLVDQGFFARCRQGSNWGYSDSLIWAGNGCRAEFEVVYRRAGVTAAADPAKPLTRTISCGRASGELYPCETDGYVDTVRLVRELSSNTCRQKFNWDYARTFVWARSGCRGVFEVTYGDTLAGAPSPGTNTGRITCGTQTAGQVSCKTAGHATDVRLVRDLGSTRCRHRLNWGYTDSSVWTSHGCRGEFEVTYRGGQTKPATLRLVCGTTSSTMVQCNTGGQIEEARVLRSLGTSECRRGDNWKHAGTSISAGHGCRAEFLVTFRSDTAPQMKPVAPASRVVGCGNASGAAMSCNAFGTVATVRLQRDRSGGRCGQPSSWGLDDQSIWVARGCYGDFELTYTSARK